jgi:hypothetical protein
MYTVISQINCFFDYNLSERKVLLSITFTGRQMNSIKFMKSLKKLVDCSITVQIY